MKKRTRWLLLSLGVAAGVLWWYKKQKEAEDD